MTYMVVFMIHFFCQLPTVAKGCRRKKGGPKAYNQKGGGLTSVFANQTPLAGRVLLRHGREHQLSVAY